MNIKTGSFRIASAILLAMVFFSASCNRATKKVIGVVPKGRAHLFWQSVHAGAEKAAQENGIEIMWNGPATETDFNGQLQIVDAMINRRVDAIALAPIDKKAMVSIVERAFREQIPVIIFDSGVDTDHFVSQIATDNYAAGKMAAARMGKILNGKGKIAIVAVQVGAASTMLREQGFEDAIKSDFPGIRIVDKRFGEADFAKSMRAAENILTAYSDLDAMFASNESSTVGAAQALKARQSKVKLVGFDAGPTLEADLRSGVIDSLVVQHPFKMGYESIVAAVQKLKGETPRKIHDLAPRLVVKEDLDKPDVQEQLNPDLKKYLK
ncbi:MAG TPA: substrate-binding domain-containing protein [Bryobacteraceae bacterium]|nr:substrate-binding domain-containing protein [Bryobacteraceae bacterium]